MKSVPLACMRYKRLQLASRNPMHRSASICLQLLAHRRAPAHTTAMALLGSAHTGPYYNPIDPTEGSLVE